MTIIYNYKGFIIFVHCYNCKLLVIDDFYLLDYGQLLCSAINLPNKFSFCKPYVYTTEDRDKYLQNQFYFSVGHQKSFQKN